MFNDKTIPVHKGRGALSNRESRYRDTVSEWDETAIEPSSPVTECTAERAKTIISRNRSPDVPFEQSINPYRGCEHGCIYCFARPTHAYLDLSPGLDFETRLRYKVNAAEILEQQLQKPGYRCTTIVLGPNTDVYQPLEKRYGITRSVLQVLQRYRHPVSIITKGGLISRDLDILAEMAQHNLCSVVVSVTTLDRELKRKLEPRTASPQLRLKLIRQLSDAGIPVCVLAAPMIPVVNDMELERILQRAAEAGASSAGYVMLRLPREIKDLFREWLQAHYPLRAKHVMNIVQQSRGGNDYDARFGYRMTGTGIFADLLKKRFDLACRRLQLNAREHTVLDTSQFCRPQKTGDQLSLF